MQEVPIKPLEHPIVLTPVGRGTTDREIRIVLVALALGAALSALLIGQLINSDFSILDDYRIIEWLGPDNELHFNDIWTTLMSTEIGAYGNHIRFRPVYYAALVLEAWAWGDNPVPYHLVQIIAFAIFLASIIWAAIRSIGPIAGGALVFLTLNYKCWSNISTYSFEPDQIAMVGFGLAVFGFGGAVLAWVRTSPRLNCMMLLAGVGVLIAAGSKENFIFLAAPYTVLLAFAGWRRQLGPATFALASTLLLGMLLIAYGIMWPNIGKATDIYGADNSISHRLGVVYNASWTLVALPTFVLGAIFAMVSYRSRLSKTKPMRQILATGIVLMGAALYLAWEVFFYNGRIPSGIRYDFPRGLIYPIIFGALYFSLVIVLRQRLHLGDRAIVLVSCVFAATIGLGTGYFNRFNYLPIVGTIQHSNLRTQMMQTHLVASRDKVAVHPDWPVVVVPAHPLDWETTYTAPIWFKRYHIENPIGILARIEPEHIRSPFERWLVDQMLSWALKGSPNRFEATSAQINEAMSKGECFEVALAEPLTSCILLPYHPRSYLPVQILQPGIL